MGLTRPNARPRTIRRTLDRMKIPVRAFSGAPFAFRRAATRADVDPPTRCRRAQCRDRDDDRLFYAARRSIIMERARPGLSNSEWSLAISPLPGGRPFHGANLMSLCRGTKVSFGSTGEVSAAPAASAVRMEESRNVRRFMILSFEARRSFANARFRRGRGFVSRWRRGPRRGGQRRSFTRPRSKERRRTSHSTSNGAPNSG